MSVGELADAVRRAEPTAYLVPQRILSRVIKQHSQLTGLELRVPHRKSYVIGRDELLDIVAPDELGVEQEEDLPEVVILIAQPSAEKLAVWGASKALVRCWRLLFHCRVHLALAARRVQGLLDGAMVRRRVAQIGEAAFEEIRSVLEEDSFLSPSRDDLAVYEEFAAVYLEWRYFAPNFLPYYFPAVEDYAAVERLLVEDVDAPALLRASRPAGAPDPEDYRGLEEPEALAAAEAEADDAIPPSAARPHEGRCRRLLRLAQEAAGTGNVVRAAIFRARALEIASPPLAVRARDGIRADVTRLVGRLEAAGVSQSSPKAWHDALLALVRQTPRGRWTPEARLLYDLQKACIDQERPGYTVDALGWLASWGRRPIRRELPHRAGVLSVKHLRSALGRLSVVRLAPAHRRQLFKLLSAALESAEQRVRERFRPLLARALDDVDLRPTNVPERVARRKLIEELLDRIVQRGHLSMSELRDALSRNNLKLPDLAELRDLWRGDQLLRADSRLAELLDGVYRHGEFYLRWMQRLSSLAFGTRPGRFFTRYFAVPFGGAYLGLAFLDHLVEMFFHVELGIRTTLSVLALGLFILGLLYHRGFRGAVWQGTKALYRAGRAVLVDAPLWLLRLPAVQEVLQSRYFDRAWRMLLKPGIFTAAILVVLPWRSANWIGQGGTALSLFLALNLLLNSRWGRALEEMVQQWVVQNVRRYGLLLVTGLFWMIVDLSKRAVESIEQLTYSVDEWLQFRSGESGLSFAAKGLLGAAWFAVAYVLRFCVTLLIEPQVNPIKHFPVVTVSHKLLIPLYEPFGAVLSLTMGNWGYAVAGAIIFGIPGIFGFLVWELKENWRLYAANRPKGLRPVVIGRHGETMSRLLKPGFHSGTIPKAYARLRRAERSARSGGNWHSARRRLQALEHVQRGIRCCVEREFAALLSESACWPLGRLRVERPEIATNRVRIALGRSDEEAALLRLAIQLESGRLVADMEQPGWLQELSPQPRKVLDAALRGLYKSLQVESVREQGRAASGRCEGQNGTTAGEPLPRPADDRGYENPSRFAAEELPWENWVRFWQEEQDGRPPAEVLPGASVLPPAGILAVTST